MPVVKQKTVGGDTYKLKRRRTTRNGKQYEYFVEQQGGGRVGDPVYTKEDGMREFRETINAVRRAEGEDRNEERRSDIPGVGGFNSGGGGLADPSPPSAGGFGMGEPEDDDDDDDPFAWM